MHKNYLDIRKAFVGIEAKRQSHLQTEARPLNITTGACGSSQKTTTNHRRDEAPRVTTAEAVNIIKKFLVNRRNRYTTYCTDRTDSTRVVQYMAPTPTRMENVPKKERQKHHLGKAQLTNHVLQNGFPIGVLAISNKDKCKWLAWDLQPDSGNSEAILHCIRKVLYLDCILERCAKTSSTIWLPLGITIPAQEAFLVAKYVAEAITTGDEAATVNALPNRSTHWNRTQSCSGGWVRLPGKNPHEHHASYLVLPDGQVIEGLDIWGHFRDVAEENSLLKWKAAYTKVVAMREGQ